MPSPKLVYSPSLLKRMGGTDQVRSTRRSPAITDGGDMWQKPEGAPKNLASDATINLDQYVLILNIILFLMNSKLIFYDIHFFFQW